MQMSRCDTSVITEAVAALGTATGPALSGLWNSGGILQDAIITAQTAAHIRSVFAPKLFSAWAMQHAATGQPVQHQLLFSSAASLFGAPGQSNYVAANAALEGWVASSLVTGRVQVAVQWGAWAAGRKLVGSSVVRTSIGALVWSRSIAQTNVAQHDYHVGMQAWQLVRLWNGEQSAQDWAC